MKKILSFILSFVMIMVPLANVFAVEPGKQMVAIGGDLNASQRQTVYDYFGVSEGSVDEITVTHDDEKQYLQDVDPSRIGSNSISSIYIETKNEGDGLDIELHNIDWLTEDIYQNALLTVGIKDAKIVIAAPFNVSGTAALTGVYKAYEQMTGETVSDEAKEAATEELVTTGELSDDIGSEDASKLVNELKLSLDDLKNMDDEQAKEEIKNIADGMNITLTDEQLTQLLDLVRSLEGVDFSGVMDELKNISNQFSDLGIWDKIVNFFQGLFN